MDEMDVRGGGDDGAHKEELTAEFDQLLVEVSGPEWDEGEQLNGNSRKDGDDGEEDDDQNDGGDVHGYEDLEERFGPFS